MQGRSASLAEFGRRLRAEAPPLARITDVRVADVAADPACQPEFRIVPSQSAPGTTTPIPPDIAVCDDCIAELFDPLDRRYRHPFVTCTNCGPRFTIIRQLPYDRPATTMSGIANAHAAPPNTTIQRIADSTRQPIACPDGGPRLWFASERDQPGEPDRTRRCAAQVAR